MSTVVSEYQTVLSFLFGRINYERIALPQGSTGFKLQIMRALLDRLDNPQTGQRIVHVAGTKGKGSTATMIGTILTAADYSTGLYTSPHLDRVEERVCINGLPCTEAQFVELMRDIIPAVERMDREAHVGRMERGPTFFEITTALALLHFAQQRVDVMVLEVGLGGRLDSTNVCDPLISVITSISFDHTKTLGNSLASIAAEKAGIIKPGKPVVCGVTDPEPGRVIERIAAERNSDLFRAGRDFWIEQPVPCGSQASGRDPIVKMTGETFSYLESDRESGHRRYDNVMVNLLGRHQAANAALAIAVTERMNLLGWEIPEKAMRHGLANVRCPARVEILSQEPVVVLDIAHNVASIRSLVATIDERVDCEQRILIFATSRDKHCAAMLRVLFPHFDHVILTRYVENPRALSLDRLESIATRVRSEMPAARGDGESSIDVCCEPASSWDRARLMAGARDLICICGSTFIAGEIRRLITNGDTLVTERQ